MANETVEEQSPQPTTDNNNEVKVVKGYRKKSLVSEKVLLDRLSEMDMEDHVINPVITLSSVEDDADVAMEEEDEEEEDDDINEVREEVPRTNNKLASRRSLNTSLSLDVPSLNLAQEAKRPPL